ncbi:TonB-dependent receptor [Sediminibacterium sp. KACHI17]|uniref:TonB-dependent receptor n=1 Tax=Sediminibacterium sp. KACHI17 TaxID=1751071 RepID=A0AAT9GL31_9BACT
MNRRMIALLLGTLIVTTTDAQEKESKTKIDSSFFHAKFLPDITLVGRYTKADIHFLPEIVGTTINAGKKNALIMMDNVQGNVVTNTMRQVMAKVPGIQIWESDPSGIQIGIAARGLSPNRSWEFNLRQNGYDISSDPFGYPEAYYTPQLNSVQRVQVLRGAASLQYGPQFGGMVNFIMKDGSEINKPFQYESQQTAGSFGLFNSYNAIGGENGKTHYYAFWDHRRGDGFRENSGFKVNTAFGNFSWNINKRLKVGLEITHFDYVSQQPGGLTDAQFAQDAYKSLRQRNWFEVKWNMAALNVDYTINDKSRLNVKTFAMTGDRNSVGFMQTPNIADTINATTLRYNNRRVDIDRYRNFGIEARYITDYQIGKMRNTLSAGIRYFRGRTDRLQNGKGDTGSDYNLNILEPFPTDLNFITNNTAFFAENMFRIGDKLVIIPGVRVENIQNEADGRVGLSGNTELKINNQNRTRRFVLPGVGAEYHIGQTEIYANYSQAYRPVLFSDLTGNPTTDVIDQNLKDAKGYNIDLGYRGRIKEYLFFDVSGYLLQYNNRIGLIAQQRLDGSFYNLRTNVGNSRSRGVEALVEFSPFKAWGVKPVFGNLTVFVSLAFINAQYDNLRVITRQGNTLVESNLKNKKVENAPERIYRTGITYSRKQLTVTAQYSYVSEAYSDANNTIIPTSNGVNGLIPAYDVVDISGTYKFSEKFFIKGGINNVLGEKYFTRRAGGYPGPGLMAAEPRNFFMTLGVKL